MAIDNKQIARRLIEEVWNQGKLDLIDELVDPNYTGRDPMLGAHNREGFRESVKAYRAAFPDLKIEAATMVGEGNFVCTRWTSSGTHRGPFMGMPATGKSSVGTGINFAEIRNGKLFSDFQEFDSLSLLRQLGLDTAAMPVPGRQPTVEIGKRT